jgi:hypothetical protein
VSDEVGAIYQRASARIDAVASEAEIQALQRASQQIKLR